MAILGDALGLAVLSADDMVAAGSTNPAQWEREIMSWSWTGSEPTWGPGDRAGLAAVGAVNGCF